MSSLTLRSAFGATGLNVSGPIPYDDWETLGHTIGTIHRATPWIIGDWVCLGEALFGSDCNPSLEGLNPDTVRRYSDVARAIPPVDRREALSWYAHSILVSLARADRNVWLTKAELGGWDSSKLKAEATAAGALKPRGVPDDRTDLTPREALTLVKADPVWHDIATAALDTLDDIELITCPGCGHRFAA